MIIALSGKGITSRAVSINEVPGLSATSCATMNTNKEPRFLTSMKPLISLSEISHEIAHGDQSREPLLPFPLLRLLSSVRLFHPRPSTLCLRLRLGHTLPRFRLDGLVFRCDGSDWSCCAQNLVDCIMADLAELRASGRIRACIKPIFGLECYVFQFCADLTWQASHKHWIDMHGLLVEELLHRKLVKEASEMELEEFVQLLMSAKTMPPCSKPSKSSWMIEEKFKQRIKILEAMGLSQTSSAAMNLLIDIGYFPVHVNLDLSMFNIHTEHSDQVLSSAENLLMLSSNPDENNRKDLTFLKVVQLMWMRLMSLMMH